MFQNQTLRKKKELGSYLNHPANIVSSIQNEKTYEIRSGIQRQPILELSLYSLDIILKSYMLELLVLSGTAPQKGLVQLNIFPQVYKTDIENSIRYDSENSMFVQKHTLT